MWRGCVGGMVCFDRERESLPIFCIFQMFDLCNHCKNVQLSKCAIREKCAIFSKKAPAFWLTGAELFICFWSDGISGTMYSPYDFFLNFIIFLQIYPASYKKIGEFLIGIIGEIRIKFCQFFSYVLRIPFQIGITRRGKVAGQGCGKRIVFQNNIASRSSILII